MPKSETPTDNPTIKSFNVVAALLYGKSDFGKSIRMAVETDFDTDCNGLQLVQSSVWLTE